MHRNDELPDLPPPPPANAPLPEGASFPENTPPPAQETTAAGTLLRPRQRFWQRFGGEGFLISLGLHAVVGIGALFYVVSYFTAPNEKQPDDFTVGAGGGNNGANAKMFEQRIKPKNTRNLVKSQNKLAVKGGKTSVALPDMPQMQMSALESGALAGGPAKGAKTGDIGIGSGGGKNMVSRFGMKGFGSTGGLTGTFYDLKQLANKTPSDLGKGYEDKAGIFLGAPVKDCWGYNRVLNNFIKNNWKVSILDAYFKAPDPLIATQIYIPTIDAGAAPKDFGVAELAKPSRWAVHYKGRVVAPKSGKIRFIGFADDVLVVRFGDKVVLDSGYTNPSIDIRFGQGLQHPLTERLHGSAERYRNTPLRCSAWIEVYNGREYPVEILIGETPGGLFSAVLFCEETKDGKKPDGNPFLFKVGNTPIDEKDVVKGFYPEVDITGGVWVWLPGKQRGSNAAR